MKQKNIGIIIMEVLVVGLMLDFILYTWWFGHDRSKKKYMVYRLSTESNPNSEDEDYYFMNYFQKRGPIFRYSLETGEQAEYNLQVPEEERIKDTEIVGDRMYYALSNHTVRQFDFNTRTDEEILSEADMLSMCGLDQWSQNAVIFICKSKEDLLLVIEETSEYGFFLCPMDGDLKKDWVDVNELFPEEDRTGREQEMIYRGICVKRYYDVERERYRIMDYWEMESGRSFVTRQERCTIKAGERQVILDHTWGERDQCYQLEGEEEKRKITCLNTRAYQYAALSASNLTTEGGEIIGLVSVSKNRYYDETRSKQREVKYEALFRLDPETGENSVLYRTRNNRTRIIGYQDGVVYLLNTYGNHCGVYGRTVESGRVRKIAELPWDTNYIFDWQGDYLIVIRRESIIEAYKVK